MKVNRRLSGKMAYLYRGLLPLCYLVWMQRLPVYGTVTTIYREVQKATQGLGDHATVPSVSLLHCVTTCTTLPGCSAVNFCHTNNSCELFSESSVLDLKLLGHTCWSHIDLNVKVSTTESLTAAVSTGSTTTANIAPTVNCPNDFIAIGSQCYHIDPGDVTVDYAVAYTKCNDWGAMLAAFETLEEFELVRAYLIGNHRTSVTGTSASKGWMIGGMHFVGGDFNWLTNAKLIPQSCWASGYPFNLQAECVEMRNKEDFKFVNSDCDVNDKYFICEIAAL